MKTPKTGERCGCRRGQERDNCPNCEGSGWKIDFRAIHQAADSARGLSTKEEQESERFDDHALDLDAWRADQERLRVLESAAHARIDRAALGILEAGETLPVEGSPARFVSGPRPYRSALDDTDPLGITFCPVCREPAHATETDDENRHPGCRDSDALDRIARRMRDLSAWIDEAWPNGIQTSPIPKGVLDGLDDMETLLRSTGRGC